MSAQAAVRQHQQTTVPVRSDPDIIEARGRTRLLAQAAGFSPTEVVLIATAVSELARNIVQFAGSGEIRAAVLTVDERTVLRLEARDSGPGIANIEQAMRDGFSTCGALGMGLPGVKRIMDTFRIESQLGKGTTVTCQKCRR